MTLTQNQRRALEKLRSALAEAIEEMEDMINYVPDYIRQKWEYDEAIVNAKRHLDEADNFLCITEKSDE